MTDSSEPEDVCLEVNRVRLLEIVEEHDITLPLGWWQYPTAGLRQHIRQQLQERQDMDKQPEDTSFIRERSVVFYQKGFSSSVADKVVLERSVALKLLIPLHLTEEEGRLEGEISPSFFLERIQMLMVALAAKRPDATHATLAFQLGGLFVFAMRCREQGHPISWTEDDQPRPAHGVSVYLVG